MANKTDLYEKLRQSISFISNNDDNEPEIYNEDTELLDLNNRIKEIKIQQENIQSSYNLLVDKHHSVYKGLIGASILNYYIEYAHKFLSKVQILVKKVSFLNEDGDLIKLLKNLDYLLHSNPSKIESINSLLQTTSSIIEQLEENVSNISGSFDNETGQISITDNSDARFKYSFIKKSGYVKMFDVSGPNMYIYVTIYGCLDANGKVNDDEIFITCTALGLTNVKLVKVRKKIKFFVWEWKYNEYRGAVQDEADPDNIYGIVLSFKSSFFGGYNSLFSDNFYRVKLKKGFYIDGITYQHNNDNYGKYYTKFLQVETDENSGFSVNKFLNYIKNTTLEDNVFKDTGPGEHADDHRRYQPEGIDEDPNIRYVYKDSDQESIKVGLYTAKYRPYISKSRIQTKIVLDRDSLDYTNENSLCDFATVSISDLTTKTFNIENMQFDASGVEEIDGVSYYTFKASYTPGADAKNGTLGNNIPLIIYISKGQTSTTSGGTNVQNQSHNLNIEVSINSKEDVILQEKDYDLYGQFGAYSSPSVLRQSQSQITDIDEIKEDPLYILIYTSTVLKNFSNLTTEQQRSEIIRLMDLVSNNKNEILNQLLIYLQNIYRALNTISQCDSIRKTYDSNYDNSLYSDLSTIIQTTASEMTNISDVTSVKTLIANKLNIDNLEKKINLLYDQIKKLLDDLLVGSIYLDEMIDSYACMLTKKDNSKEILESLKTAMLIYEGRSTFSEALSLSGSAFLPLNVGTKSFDYWYENIFDYLVDSDIIIARYYILIIILCNLCSYRYDNRNEYIKYINDLLLKLINRLSVDTNLFPNSLITNLQLNNYFSEAYGFYVVTHPNIEKVSSYLTYKYPKLNELNEIDIEISNNRSVYDYNTIIKSKLLLFLLSDISNIDNRINDLYEYLSKYKNYRSIVILSCLDEVLDFIESSSSEKLSTFDYTKRSNDFLAYSNASNSLDTPISQCISSYNQIKNNLYASNINIGNKINISQNGGEPAENLNKLKQTIKYLGLNDF